MEPPKFCTPPNEEEDGCFCCRASPNDLHVWRLCDRNAIQEGLFRSRCRYFKCKVVWVIMWITAAVYSVVAFTTVFAGLVAPRTFSFRVHNVHAPARDIQGTTKNMSAAAVVLSIQNLDRSFESSHTANANFTHVLFLPLLEMKRDLRRRRLHRRGHPQRVSSHRPKAPPALARPVCRRGSRENDRGRGAPPAPTTAATAANCRRPPRPPQHTTVVPTNQTKVSSTGLTEAPPIAARTAEVAPVGHSEKASGGLAAPRRERARSARAASRSWAGTMRPSVSLEAEKVGATGTPWLTVVRLAKRRPTRRQAVDEAGRDAGGRVSVRAKRGSSCSNGDSNSRRCASWYTRYVCVHIHTWMVCVCFLCADVAPAQLAELGKGVGLKTSWPSQPLSMLRCRAPISLSSFCDAHTARPSVHAL